MHSKFNAFTPKSDLKIEGWLDLSQPMLWISAQLRFSLLKFAWLSGHQYCKCLKIDLALRFSFWENLKWRAIRFIIFSVTYILCLKFKPKTDTALSLSSPWLFVHFQSFHGCQRLYIDICLVLEVECGVHLINLFLWVPRILLIESRVLSLNGD